MSLLARRSTRIRSTLLVLSMVYVAACGGAGAGGGQAPDAAATAQAILSHPVTNLPNITVSFTVDGVDHGSYTITQPSKAYVMALLKHQMLGIDAKDNTWHFDLTINQYTGPGEYTVAGYNHLSYNTGYVLSLSRDDLSQYQDWGIASNAGPGPACQVRVRTEEPLGTLNFDGVYEITGDFTCSQVPTLEAGVPGPINLTNGQFATPMTVCQKSC